MAGRSNIAPQWEDAYAVVEPQINADGRHVYPFNPLFPLDVRFFRCGRYARIRSNRHDYFEMFYLHSGGMVQEVQNRHLQMHAGDLFVVGSTLLHRMTEFRTPSANIVVLYFLPELIRDGGNRVEEAEYLMPFLAQGDDFPHVIPAQSGVPRQVYDGMVRIHGELRGGSKLGWLAAKTYLKWLLVLLARHYPLCIGGEQIFNRKQRSIERLRPAFDFVDQNYDGPIALEDAAHRVQMSKPNFIRLFKQVTGQPFVAYLNQFRVTKAQELLASTNKSVAEISQDVGFCDQSYFGTVFRRLVHLTPREYRQHADGHGLPAMGVALVRPPDTRTPW